MSDQELLKSECDRLQFIIDRDGVDSAISFAHRGIKGYRSVIKATKGILTKRALILSCVVYRRFLYSNGVVWFSI